MARAQGMTAKQQAAAVARVAKHLVKHGEVAAVRETYADEWGGEHTRTVSQGFVVEPAGDDDWRGIAAYVEHFGGSLDDRMRRAKWYACWLDTEGWRVEFAPYSRDNTLLIVRGRKA